jgi:glucokinase
MEQPMTRAALALDLGGTKLDAALVDGSGAIVSGTRFRRPTGRDLTPDGLRAALAAVVREVRDAAPAAIEIVGAGIGSAGPVARDIGAIHPVNMPGLHGFPLVAAVEDALRAAGLDAPVMLGHDGGCLALAEAWKGAAHGATASLSIVVSTGIGGGIVVGGSLVGGASGNAGHLGQTFVGDVTVEEIASGPASIAWARSHGWEGTTGMELAASAATGDRTARAAVVRSAEAVGAALADATTLLDLDVIAIGGGFSRVAPDYVDLVGGALRSRAVVDFARAVRVVRSGLGDDGPLMGAAALVHGTA